MYSTGMMLVLRCSCEGFTQPGQNEKIRSRIFDARNPRRPGIGELGNPGYLDQSDTEAF